MKKIFIILLFITACSQNKVNKFQEFSVSEVHTKIHDVIETIEYNEAKKINDDAIDSFLAKGNAICDDKSLYTNKE